MTIFAMVFPPLPPWDFARRRAKFLYRRRRLGNAELFDDGRDNVTGMRLDRNHDRTFVRLRLLQRRELAVEQRRRHEMIVTGGNATRDQVAPALEKNDAHVAPRADQYVAIGALERRAGDDAMVARFAG